MSRRRKVQFWLELFVDIFCLTIANAVSYVIFHFIILKIAVYPLTEWIRYFFALIISYSIVRACFYSTINIAKRSREAELLAVFQNTSLTYLFFSTFILLLKSPIIESRYMLLSSYLLFTAFLLPAKYMLKRWITDYYTYSRTASIAGIITTSDLAEEFVGKIKEDWSHRVTGIVLVDRVYAKTAADGYGINSDESICDIPVVSDGENYMDWIRSAPIDEIFINLSFDMLHDEQSIIEELEDMGITVHINIPSLNQILNESKFNNINCRVYAGYPMATFAPANHNSAMLVIKRVLDIIFAIIGCILSAPIIAAVAIPLKQGSPGPLFFKQIRIGKNGRPFYIYKLRSMYVDAEERKAELMTDNEMEGHMFKLEDDPRITKVGKFIRKYSIDELPQFFNVLKGDMSLIGTRPPTEDEFYNYERRHRRRLSMRPGITGMWQVSGRSQITDFEEVVKLDCQYIDEWSLLLDAKIFFKTIYVVLFHKGAE